MPTPPSGPLTTSYSCSVLKFCYCYGSAIWVVLATVHSVGMIPSCTCNFTLCCPVGLSWLIVTITLKQSDVFRFLRLDDDGNLRIYSSGGGSRIKIARWSQFLSAYCAATRRLSDAALVCCCQTCATRLLIGFEKARDFWGSWL